MAAEFEVFRLVHNTHAPAANLIYDAVMGNRLTHGLGWRGHWLDMYRGERWARSMKRLGCQHPVVPSSVKKRGRLRSPASEAIPGGLIYLPVPVRCEICGLLLA